MRKLCAMSNCTKVFRTLFTGPYQGGKEHFQCKTYLRVLFTPKYNKKRSFCLVSCYFSQVRVSFFWKCLHFLHYICSKYHSKSKYGFCLHSKYTWFSGWASPGRYLGISNWINILLNGIKANLDFWIEFSGKKLVE